MNATRAEARTLLEEAERLDAQAAAQSWPSYPEFRDGGAAWLGDLPAQWQTRRLKLMAKVQFSNVDKKSDDGEEPIRLCNYVDVYHNDYITDEIEFMQASASRAEIARFALRRGDVLITKDSEEWNDIAVPAFVRDELPGVICGYHLAQVRPDPNRVDGEYLFRAFAARGISDQFRVAANGITRYGLGRLSITGALFPLPPLPEQRAIAAFLDRHTRRIDELITKKRRLIELLQEKRAALTSHAVTKGLDPAVPMMPSGIEWLGDVPEHWTVGPMYSRYSVELGKMLDAKRITGEYLVPYLRNVDVRWDYVNVDDLPEMDIEAREYERFTLRTGDILVCEGGEVGRTAFWREELPLCAYQKALHRIRSIDVTRDVPRFLYYVMYAASKGGVFIAGGNPNTIPHLTGEKLRVYRFAFPPIDEQRAIVAYLEAASATLDRLIDTAEVAVARLGEYRSALISAAVTGKIDVREVLA